MNPREFDIDRIFTYQAPKPEQIPHFNEIREAARIFAHALIAHTPAGADQAAALRQLRECVMTANAAIALDGELFKP